MTFQSIFLRTNPSSRRNKAGEALTWLKTITWLRRMRLTLQWLTKLQMKTMHIFEWSKILTVVWKRLPSITIASLQDSNSGSAKNRSSHSRVLSHMISSTVCNKLKAVWRCQQESNTHTVPARNIWICNAIGCMSQKTTGRKTCHSCWVHLWHAIDCAFPIQICSGECSSSKSNTTITFLTSFWVASTRFLR